MSCSLLQGLQSWLEPGLVEQHVQSIKTAEQKLNSPLPSTKILHFDPEDRKYTPLNDEEEEDCEIKNNSNPEISEWSFLQILTQTNQGINEKIDTNNVYVDPLLKRSSSMLSEKSLEMCTESLGSESGSDVIETMDDEKLNYQTTINTNKYGQKWLADKIQRKYSFPPPLSSISGLRGLRVKSHREGGRLVLMAIESNSSRSGFHTQRGNGRLRLQLFKDGEEECNHDHEALLEEDDDDADDDNDEEMEEDTDEDLWNKELEKKGRIRKSKGKFSWSTARSSSRCNGANGGENEGLNIWEPVCLATLS